MKCCNKFLRGVTEDQYIVSKGFSIVREIQYVLQYLVRVWFEQVMLYHSTALW